MDETRVRCIGIYMDILYMDGYTYKYIHLTYTIYRYIYRYTYAIYYIAKYYTCYKYNASPYKAYVFFIFIL